MSPSGGRPVVTYALFAFNQERFIRQAVEAALAQTYQPLEIILSDDFSSDKTFAIMSEMASNYLGPHQIRLVRNPTNIGVLAHVIARGREAQGDIVVLAAGDDISLPDRTERLVAAFTPETGCVFSRVSIVDDKDRTIAPIAERPLFVREPQIFLRQSTNNHPVIQGCSAAYRSWVFDVPIDPQGKAYPEDLLFSFYINLKGGRITRLEAPLVAYRAHAEALSNARERPYDPPASEKRGLRNAKAQLQMLDDFEAVANRLGASDHLDLSSMGRERQDMQDFLGWAKLRTRARLARALHPGRVLGRNSIWRLLRLFGSFPRYQPRTFLARFLPMLR